MMKTSVLIVSLSFRSLPGEDSNATSSGRWMIWSTQVDKTQIFQVTAPSALIGSNTIFPAQLSAGELVRNDKPQSMNI